MRLRIAVPLLLMGLGSVPAHAAVRAWLSASAIAPGDTVQLTLEHTGATSSDPDLSALTRDFDVLGTSTSTRVQIGTGGTSAATDVILTLSPKRAGLLTIPSISWDGEHTSAQTLQVADAAGGSGSAGAASTAPAVFLDTQVAPQQPLLQAAVHVTVRLYTSEPLYHPDLEWPVGGNVLVQQVGADEQDSAIRNGQRFQLLTRHYLVFPQRSGTLELPGPVLQAQTPVQSDPTATGNDPFAGLFGGNPFVGLVSMRPIRVHADPIVLRVQPRPAGLSTSYWLPATALSLSARWQPPSGPKHAGEPVTVTLHLQALGLTAAQLPDLSALWTLPPAVKAYPDQGQLHDVAQGDSVLGSRDQTIALIADQPGHYTLPALTVQWWDTAANRARSTTLAARSLSILAPVGAPQTGAAPSSAVSSAAQAAGPPGAGAASPAAAEAGRSAASAAGTGGTPRASRWRLLSLVLGLGWLLTAVAWACSARAGRSSGESIGAPAAAPAPRAPSAPTAAEAQSALRMACQTHAPREARRALLSWAAAHWPEDPPSGLGALAQRLPAAQSALRELDCACYRGDAWRGEALAAALAQLPPARRQRGRVREALAPLYP